MKSGPSRVNAPLKGPVIPRSRRDLFKDQSFADSYNAYTRQTGAVQWGAACKGKVGREGGAHRGWCSVGERGDGERLWVSAWCLRYIYTGVVSNETQEIGAAINRPANLLKDKAEQGAGA